MPVDLASYRPCPGDVALCQWGGDRFLAEYIGPDPEWPGQDRYLMRSRSNLPRFTSGTEIHVLKSEVADWVETPPPPEPQKFVAP